jgi:hypothetical protein
LEFVLRNNGISVIANGVLIGNMNDSCCNTLIRIIGNTGFIKVANDIGAGGFIRHAVYHDRLKHIFIDYYSNTETRKKAISCLVIKKQEFLNLSI